MAFEAMCGMARGMAIWSCRCRYVRYCCRFMHRPACRTARHLVCREGGFHSLSPVLLETKELEISSMCFCIAAITWGSASYLYVYITIQKILNSAKSRSKFWLHSMVLEQGNFSRKCIKIVTLILNIMKLSKTIDGKLGIKFWILRCAGRYVTGYLSRHTLRCLR